MPQQPRGRKPEATRAGRRTEVTRGGTPVRTARSTAGRVVALVEHPAADEARREGELPLRVV